jgi:hypothetical protein
MSWRYYRYQDTYVGISDKNSRSIGGYPFVEFIIYGTIDFRINCWSGDSLFSTLF